MIGLKKTNIEKIQMIWKQTDKSNVLKKPNFSRTLETIKPAEISPKGEQDAMIPIVDSEKPSYFWRITITVIKYPILNNVLKYPKINATKRIIVLFPVKIMGFVNYYFQ